MKRIILLLLLGLNASFSSVYAETIIIKNAKLFPSSDNVPATDIIIEDGEITKIGSNLKAPRNARVVDSTDQVVTSGFIQAGTNLGTMELWDRANADDSFATTSAFSAGVDISYALNRNSTLIPVARKGGISHAVVMPGVGKAGAGELSFGGLAALINTGEEQDILEQSKVAVILDLTKAKVQRGAVFLLLEDKLKAAQQNAAVSRDMQALHDVVAGKIPLVVAVHRASDIEALLKVAEPFDIELILYGAAEAWMVADQLAESGASVIVEAIENRPMDFNRIGATLENAAILDKAGVQIALVAPYNGHDAQLLRYHAGIAVAHGLPLESAVKAVTSNPAKMFNMSGIGELAVGYKADILIWSGDPFQPLTKLNKMFIAGQEQSLVTRQDMLRDKYLQEVE